MPPVAHGKEGGESSIVWLVVSSSRRLVTLARPNQTAFVTEGWLLEVRHWNTGIPPAAESARTPSVEGELVA